ncbi:uncharacterized protein [Haliotis asinina]|uniref:uncharacterized protein isoform X2 n=1 Tax=Haliotis asinina TaxID=109174 RepID=UPI00353210F8
MTSQHFLPGKSLTGPLWAGKEDKVAPGEETDDQGVTRDILRVAKSISFKLTAPIDLCVESDVDDDREHFSHHDHHTVDSSNMNKKMVDVQASSTEDDMSGCETPQVPGLNREDVDRQTSLLSHPHPKSADKSLLSIVKSDKQRNAKSGRKANASKTHVLSESEDEDPAISVKPMSRSLARSSPSRLSLGIQSEPTDNQQLITCFDSMNAVNGDAAMNSDTRIQELDGDVSNFTLWLIKAPAEMSLMTLPKHIRLDGVEDFAVDTKRYELQAFDDDNLESNHVSLVQQDLNHLTEGPRFQGQIHIVRKPRDILKPVTAAKIPHNSVPFPSGLKVRFKPFGADNIVMEEHGPGRKKRGSSDVVTPPKKKKKKKH